MLECELAKPQSPGELRPTFRLEIGQDPTKRQSFVSLDICDESTMVVWKNTRAQQGKSGSTTGRLNLNDLDLFF